MTEAETETEASFDIAEPAEGPAVPYLFNSPHSGCAYSDAFLKASRLPLERLRRSEDAFVDALFSGAPAHGAALMRAHFPRAYVDLNREPYELDPQMFDGPLPRHANTRSMRVAGGLGTIARVVSDAEPIYGARIPVGDALQRIETCYLPYHEELERRLTALLARFGQAVLIDCHSMPSARIAGEDRTKPDFVLGDRYGTSCGAELAEFVHETLSALGYTVGRNKPYAGGFITERYGDPQRGFHALQIEINRGLYMDERRIRRSGGFSWLKADLDRMMKRLVAFRLPPAALPDAAE